MPTDVHGLAYELVTGIPPKVLPTNVRDIDDFNATEWGSLSRTSIQMLARLKAKEEAGFHDTVRYRILYPTGEQSTVVYTPRELASVGSDDSELAHRGWSIETED